MKEQLISFETAKLAKEKGFILFKDNFRSALVDTRNNDYQRYNFYREFHPKLWSKEYTNYPRSKDEPKFELQIDGQTNSTTIYGLADSYDPKYTKDELEVYCYLAPTQSLLQKWLREKYNIYAREELVSSELGSKEIFAPSITTEFRDWANENYCNYSFNNYYEFPEEAIEKGLQEALKLI